MLGEWTSKIGNQPYLIGMEVAKFIISRDFSFYKDKLHLYSSICIKTKLMLQSIITALIVLIAIYFVLKPLFSKKKSESACNTCSSGGCGGCPISEASRNKDVVANRSKQTKS